MWGGIVEGLEQLSSPVNQLISGVGHLVQIPLASLLFDWRHHLTIYHDRLMAVQPVGTPQSPLVGLVPAPGEPLQRRPPLRPDDGASRRPDQGRAFGSPGVRRPSAPDHHYEAARAGRDRFASLPNVHDQHGGRAEADLRRAAMRRASHSSTDGDLLEGLGASFKNVLGSLTGVRDNRALPSSAPPVADMLACAELGREPGQRERQVHLAVGASRRPPTLPTRRGRGSPGMQRRATSSAGGHPTQLRTCTARRTRMHTTARVPLKRRRGRGRQQPCMAGGGV